MENITLEEVWELVEQLPPNEQEELIKRLNARKTLQRPPLDLPVVDVGPWPDELSLLREDWYDNER